jgi:hypothetical protein
VKRNAFRASYPTALDENEFVDWGAFPAKHVMFTVDHVTRVLSELIRDGLAYRFIGDFGDVFEDPTETVCAICFVESLTKLWKLAQKS